MTSLNRTGLPGFDRVVIWFNDPANWEGPGGLLTRVAEHVIYAVIVVVAALVIALPLGLLIGHSGRGKAAIAGVTNSLRAVPSLGLLVLLIVVVSPHIHSTAGLSAILPRGSVPYAVPTLVVMVVLAIPQILSSTYAGVESVERATVEAARGLGMRPVQVVLKVELPSALPLIMSGVRSATLQVIASLTAAGYAPLIGGLGRLIVDGNQNLSDPRYGYPAMVAAGLTVAVVALVADGGLSLLQRAVTPRGLSFRTS
jgi:osmoprotectant transport system permease protein